MVLVGVDLELAAVLRVARPATPQAQALPGLLVVLSGGLYLLFKRLDWL